MKRKQLKELTDEQVGKIIAYWNRKAGKREIARIRDHVAAKLEKWGVKADVIDDLDVTKFDKPDNLGWPRVTFTILLKNPVKGVRLRNGTGNCVKNLNKIYFKYSRNAGVFDPAKHDEKHKLVDSKIKKYPSGWVMSEYAAKQIDGWKWEGEVVEITGRTDGKERGYRRRSWYPFEGTGHFQYAANLDKLLDKIDGWLCRLLYDTGLTSAYGEGPAKMWF